MYETRMQLGKEAFRKAMAQQFLVRQKRLSLAAAEV